MKTCHNALPIRVPGLAALPSQSADNATARIMRANGRRRSMLSAGRRTSVGMARRGAGYAPCSWLPTPSVLIHLAYTNVITRSLQRPMSTTSHRGAPAEPMMKATCNRCAMSATAARLSRAMVVMADSDGRGDSISTDFQIETARQVIYTRAQVGGRGYARASA